MPETTEQTSARYAANARVCLLEAQSKLAQILARDDAALAERFSLTSGPEALLDDLMRANAWAIQAQTLNGSR